MLLASEIGVTLAILAQLSEGQSIVSTVLYQQISVEANTWTDIAINTLTGLEHKVTIIIPVRSN